MDAKSVYEKMRATEFIVEISNGKITKRQQKSTRGLHLYSDSEKADSGYVSFRMGMAAAMSDGTNKLDIDSKSWAGKKKTAHPYTQVEADMLKAAYNAVGAEYEDLNHGDMNSQELDGTYTVSPVSNWNKKK
jgi:hypothetical protein